MDKFEYLSGVPEVALRFAYRPDRLVEVREAAERLAGARDALRPPESEADERS